MASSTRGGIFFIVMGAGCVLLVVMARSIRPPKRQDMPPETLRRRWRLILTFWSIAWLLMGLGWVCFGVSILRYAVGSFVVVPPSAPLFDRIVYDLGFVGVFGGLIMLYIWTLMYSVLKRTTPG